MAKKIILIFPAGMPRSIAYLNQCKEEGYQVIGSSSLAYDPAREHYSTWVTLPYVTDPHFKASLQQLIITFNIKEIYTPNIVVGNYLDQHLRCLTTDAVLANASPVDEMLSGYRTALKKAQFFMATPLPLSATGTVNAMPNKIELAGLCRYADLIPGMKVRGQICFYSYISLILGNAMFGRLVLFVQALFKSE